MDKRSRPKKAAFVALAALAIVLAVSVPIQAAGVGHGFGGGHPGGAAMHHGFEGHHFEGHRFDGHHFDSVHVRGSGLLVLLPELRGVLPERGELP